MGAASGARRYTALVFRELFSVALAAGSALMLEHIFAVVDEVHVVIGSPHIRSQRAIQRVGGTLLGTSTVRAPRHRAMPN